MNRAAFLVLPLVFLACKKEVEPDATQAAVHVKVDLNFRAGCIVVDVKDAANEANADREEVVVTEPSKRQAHVAVFRRESWGRTLKITTSARERTPEESCTGVVLDSQEDEVTLDAPGTQTLEVKLESVDGDGDGYVPTANGGTDCNDADANVTQLLYYVDGDGDEVGTGTPVRCTPPSAGYVTRSGDCDDTSATVRPGLPEVCDNLDNDCQNGADDGLERADYFFDGDDDGVGTGTAVNACAQPADHVAQSGDCNDGDSAIRPGLSEVCDGKDNNCRDGVDDGLTRRDYFLDEDQDGVGGSTTANDCAAPPNHVAQGGDCNDADTAIRPGLGEVCDEKDNDCRNGVDDGLATTTYYRDQDADTYGLQADSRVSCRPSLTGYVTRAGDCDDSANAVRPGATEECNEIDDNCSGVTDEGFNKQWYRDSDNDGFGDQVTRVNGCQGPAGYIGPTAIFDCNDSTNAVRPGATERCNEIDDNCVGGIDEPFTTGVAAKGNACSTPCPNGTYICRGDGTGTTCNAPQPTDYYTDSDGDGAGAEGATAQPVCPSQTPPANTAPNRDDCDDQDRHNWRNNTEVCDDRDNNCAGGVDEANVCDGAGWAAVTDAAVSGSRNWNTVAVNQGSADGYPVWIAGAGGVLARRSTATSPFTSFDGQCGNTNWNAAWVRPSDGRVYLAGSGGMVAEFNGTTCTQYTMSGSQNGTGIVGFETGTPATVRLYVVDVSGRLHSWTPQSAPPNHDPVQLEDAGAVYRDVHGFNSSRIFLAGQDANSGNPPIISRYTGSGSTALESIGSFSNNLNIRGVWMGAANFAYAVGDASIVVRWNGANWTTVTPPGTVNFTSVCAPDPSSGYTTDTLGIIRRYTGSGWVPHHDAGGELRDIALSSPGNVWAVGPGGRVVHFPGR